MSTTKRVRTSDTLVPNSYTQLRPKRAGGDSNIYGIQSGCTRGQTRFCEDHVTPNFRKRQAAGEVINNPFYSSTVIRDYATSGWGYNYLNPSSTYIYNESLDQCITSDAMLDDVVYDSSTFSLKNMKILCGTRAMAGVLEPDLFGALELAESNKTARMLLNPTNDMRVRLQKIKETRKYQKYLRHTKGAKLMRFLGDNWLYYRYGVTPFVKAIEEGLGVYKNGPKRSPRHTSRGYSDHTDTKSFTAEDTTASSYWNWLHSYECEKTTIVRAGVLYEHNFSLWDTTGLRLGLVPAVAYELLPWSFVADWFINTNDLINAVSPKSGVKYLAKFTTTKVRDFRSLDTTSFWKYTGTGASERTVPSETRTCLTQTTVRKPGLSTGLATKVHEITFKKSLDWKRLGDAFALVVGVLQRP